MISCKNEQTQNYTLMMPCIPVGSIGQQCPSGWTSVGYTQPASCSIGDTPGDGHMDMWRLAGYNKICKKTVPTSGDMSIDCCSNLFNISNSVECKARGYEPYTWTCNNIMNNRCGGGPQKNPYSPEWNGMPNGQKIPIYDSCKGTLMYSQKEQLVSHQKDEFCDNYFRNAPPNDFFHTNDPKVYSYYFPRYSYATPAFSGTWGYYPMRPAYYPYNDYKIR